MEILLSQTTKVKQSCLFAFHPFNVSILYKACGIVNQLCLINYQVEMIHARVEVVKSISIVAEKINKAQ